MKQNSGAADGGVVETVRNAAFRPTDQVSPVAGGTIEEADELTGCRLLVSLLVDHPAFEGF